MTEDDAEYRRLVELKMIARAERNALLRQAEQAAEAEAVREAAASQERGRLEKLKQAEQTRLREAAIQARRQRPALIGKFRADPKGLRHVETLRRVCLQCGSDRVLTRPASQPPVQVCQTCWAEWHMSGCWSCTTGRLDSRDPETPRCTTCGWTKCAVCGACRPAGCSTNPYSTSHRHRDPGLSSAPEAGVLPNPPAVSI